MIKWEQQPVLRILPDRLKAVIESLPEYMLQDLEEIRLRRGSPATLRVKGEELPILAQGKTVIVTGRMLDQLLERATDHSAYASDAYLKQGFVTVSGGHRIGFCGQAVVEQGKIHALRSLSSASIRIAKAVPGYAAQLRQYIHQATGSVLVIGPPGAGKTTLLRELTRLLSDEFWQNVSLIDERFEIAACRNGEAVFSVGTRTDILSGCPKAEGLYIMLRTMSPQWLVVDEITEEEDILAIRQASYCGVKIAATAHAASKTDLENRPLYQSLLALGIFHTLITITMNHQIRGEALT